MHVHTVTSKWVSCAIINYRTVSGDEVQLWIKTIPNTVESLTTCQFNPRHTNTNRIINSRFLQCKGFAVADSKSRGGPLLPISCTSSWYASDISVSADSITWGTSIMEDTVVQDTDCISSVFNDSYSNLLSQETGTVDVTEILSEENSVGCNTCFDMFVLNRARDESYLLVDLCNCDSVHSNWSFIHDKVNDKQVYYLTKSNDFGFLSNGYPPFPLFRPGQELRCENLLQWSCDAHTIVSATKCSNYQSVRIKVPTKLNIGNWRALCGNFED